MGAEEDKTPNRMEACEEAIGKLIGIVEELSKKIDELEKSTLKKSKGLFGGKREKVAIKDTKTGTIYPSKASVGKNLYDEIEGGDPGDHFMWYKLISKFPERFVDASAEEAEKAWAAEKAKIEAEVEASNKRLQAEEAKKKAAEEKKGK